MRARPLLGRLLLALCVPPLLIEGALQAGAWAVWATRSDTLVRSAPADPAPSVSPLACLGDSFTFGSGASSRDASYPSRIAARLREQGGAAPAVVNLGWPGRDSREALLVLERELPLVRPSAVLILIGTNDLWNRPEPLPEEHAESAASGFRWCWRTARLLALLRQPAPEKPQTPAEADAERSPQRVARHPLVGQWHSPEQELFVRADGTMLIGSMRMRWSDEAQRLRLTDDEGTTYRVPWRLDGERLHLDAPPPFHPLDLERVVGPSDHSDEPAAMRFARVERLLRVGSEAAARAEIDAWIESTPVDPWARLARLTLTLRSSERAMAAAELAWLLENRRDQPSRDASECAVSGLLRAGELKQLVALAHEDVVRYPDSLDLWHDLGMAARFLGERPLALEAARQCCELRPTRSAAARADARLFLALVLADGGELDAALAEMVRAWSLDPGPKQLHRFLADGQLRVERSRVEAAATAGAGSAELRERLLADWDSVVSGPAATVGITLADHLRRMVALCRAHGARPIVLDYPFAQPELDALRADVARELGVDTIEVTAWFAHRLESCPRDELFVPDGHLNDRGYDEMAGIVTEGLRRLGVLR